MRAKCEVREVISSFLGEAGNDGARVDVELEHDVRAMEDDKASEEFWASLPVEVSREKHIQDIPTKPDRYFPGKAVTSRAGALSAAMIHGDFRRFVVNPNGVI